MCWLPRPGLVTAECVLDLLCQDLITAQGETQARIPEWGAQTWPVTIPIMGGRGTWSPVVTSVTCEDQKHFLISGGVKKQHRNLSPEADCVKCPVSPLSWQWTLLLVSPVTGVHSVLQTSHQVTTCISSHSPHPCVHHTHTSLSIPCSAQISSLSPHSALAPVSRLAWSGLHLWTTLCPRPLLSDWSPRPRCWPLIGPVWPSLSWPGIGQTVSTLA